MSPVPPLTKPGNTGSNKHDPHINDESKAEYSLENKN